MLHFIKKKWWKIHRIDWNFPLEFNSYISIADLVMLDDEWMNESFDQKIKINFYSIIVNKIDLDIENNPIAPNRYRWDRWFCYRWNRSYEDIVKRHIESKWYLSERNLMESSCRSTDRWLHRTKLEPKVWTEEKNRKYHQ